MTVNSIRVLGAPVGYLRGRRCDDAEKAEEILGVFVLQAEGDSPPPPHCDCRVLAGRFVAPTRSVLITPLRAPRQL